jgi:hypothetical protein
MPKLSPSQETRIELSKRGGVGAFERYAGDSKFSIDGEISHNASLRNECEWCAPGIAGVRYCSRGRM